MSAEAVNSMHVLIIFNHVLSLLIISVRVILETHIYGDPLNPILTLCLLMLDDPLGYVGVVG